MTSFITALHFVNSISESKAWYTDFLEMSVYEEDERFVSFKIGASFLNLHLADEKSPVSSGGCVAYWLTEDLQAAIKKAESLGGKVYRGPLDVKETGRVICQIQDPYGNVFGLESEMK